MHTFSCLQKSYFDGKNHATSLRVKLLFPAFIYQTKYCRTVTPPPPLPRGSCPPSPLFTTLPLSCFFPCPNQTIFPFLLCEFVCVRYFSVCLFVAFDVSSCYVVFVSTQRRAFFSSGNREPYIRVCCVSSALKQTYINT